MLMLMLLFLIVIETGDSIAVLVSEYSRTRHTSSPQSFGLRLVQAAPHVGRKLPVMSQASP
jgi:hypothetical protein